MVHVFGKNFTQKLSVAGLVATTAALAACSTTPQDITTPAEADNITAEEVTEETESLIGQTVSVRGDVDAVAGDTTFLIDDGRFLGGEDILVINNSEQPFVIPDVGDSQVQVTGKVEQFSLENIKASYGIELEPELYVEYENQPVIVAKSMALAPDPGDITSDPSQYYFERIAVEGEVVDTMDTDIFTIQDEGLFGGEDLLVISNAADSLVMENEVVVVTGTVRPFVLAEFERDYELQWDLSVQEDLEAEYSEKPVFIADEIYPSAVK